MPWIWHQLMRLLENQDVSREESLKHLKILKDFKNQYLKDKKHYPNKLVLAWEIRQRLFKQDLKRLIVLIMLQKKLKINYKKWLELIQKLWMRVGMVLALI